MTRCFLISLIILLPAFKVNGQLLNRDKKENTEAFISRISSGKYIKDKIVMADFNTPGEKIIYFYNRLVEDTTKNRQKDSIATLRMVILIPDTMNPFEYESIDLELDYDKGYGLGIESTELIKNKKEKKLNIAVFHLVAGAGRMRMKAYENFVLKQRSNNGGFFNDFELINIK